MFIFFLIVAIFAINQIYRGHEIEKKKTVIGLQLFSRKLNVL